MLNSVKVDKLCFGINEKIAPDLRARINEVINKYYDDAPTSNEPNKYGKLYKSITPTKQLRQGQYTFNHNLQMIPLEQFSKFLKELINVAGQDLNIYEIHLAKDRMLQQEISNYIETLAKHEYTNGYVASTIEASSSNTLYIAKKKGLDSDRNQKLLIKFYDKTEELISRHPANRVLLINEPISNPNIPIGCPKGGDKEGILLYKMNLLRCEIELRENNLPYTTIEQIIEAIEEGTFQDTIENKFKEVLNNTVFIEPKKISCRTLKGIAIELMRMSDRNYKILFKNSGMTREYNYFKKAKETVTRENDLDFEEVRIALVGEQSKCSPQSCF